jgi:DNA invertase Pin-like site-specific DNA recombinase
MRAASFGRIFPVPVRKQQTLVPIKPAVPLTRAAAYMRMSKDTQEYSIHNQTTFIKKYAADHKLSIVRIYSDEGISGLRIDNRPSFTALITTVIGNRADFSKVLVYDVSRWGRFQDIDESALYEILCRRHGVEVIYCNETFGTEHTLYSSLGKTVKRAAAAEVSRDYSVRTFRGHCNLASRGFTLGGVPPYGMRKVLVNAEGKRIYGPLSPDRKVQIGCRMSLVPGPVKEVRVIREIFRRYLDLHESGQQIADSLNASGSRASKGGVWKEWHVYRMLDEEKYAGTQVYNRRSSKLGTNVRKNSPSEWIRKPNAFPAIIAPEIFCRVQERRKAAQRRLSDGEVLEMLRRLLARRGYLSERMVVRDKSMPCMQTYAKRFGSLYKAFQLIGYIGSSKHAGMQERFRRRHLRTQIAEKIRAILGLENLTLVTNATASWFCIGGRLTFSFQFLKYREGPRKRRWYRTHQGCLGKRVGSASFHILARLDADQSTVKDCYVVPREMYSELPLSIGVRNPRLVEQYRVSSLEAAIKHLVARVHEPQRFHGLMLT